MITYRVRFPQAREHFVEVEIAVPIKALSATNSIDIYLPVWSPGSYLVREYARHVSQFRVEDPRTGQLLNGVKKNKNCWGLTLDQPLELINIRYRVYAYELTVRTSWVEERFAFLQGPSVFMTVKGMESHPLALEIYPLDAWSHVATSLTLLRSDRHCFYYQALHYDELLDSPLQLGCHDHQYFMAQVPHQVAFEGPHQLNTDLFLQDLKKLCLTIQGYFGDVPFNSYQFILHFFPDLYGGLEHSASSVNQFDGRFLASRTEYLKLMGLLSHEYLHAWNVKRLRPKELGPFDYQGENYTRMLWLAEGMTQFLDDYFLYLSGLMKAKEYAQNIVDALNQYYKIPGRKYDSVEDSSFDAWIKLYRPHGQLGNLTISYYLKGQILFFALSLFMQQKGYQIHDWIKALWKKSLEHPERGFNKEEILALLAQHSSLEVAEYFDELLVTTKDPDFASLLKNNGFEPVWEPGKLSFGVEFDQHLERLIIATTWEGGACYQQGLAPGDEILAINQQRILKKDWKKFTETVAENETYTFLVSRQSQLFQLDICPKRSDAQLKSVYL